VLTQWDELQERMLQVLANIGHADVSTSTEALLDLVETGRTVAGLLHMPELLPSLGILLAHRNY
jgi:hypothetical protein